MNGIEKIISRMEADAKAERDAITAAAQQKAESIRHDYQATADTLQQEAQVRRQAQNAERLEHLNVSSQSGQQRDILLRRQLRQLLRRLRKGLVNDFLPACTALRRASSGFCLK